MTEIEKKALALVQEVQGFDCSVSIYHVHNAKLLRQALCRAIEQHEAFRQEVSDAVGSYIHDPQSITGPAAMQHLRRFIIAKPDPVRMLAEVLIDCGLDPSEGWPDEIRAAMKARGYEWRKIEEQTND